MVEGLGGVKWTVRGRVGGRAKGGTYIFGLRGKHVIMPCCD
jgi:hypothetical protein